MKERSLITGRRNRITAFIARHFVSDKTMMKFMAREIARYKEPSNDR